MPLAQAIKYHEDDLFQAIAGLTALTEALHKIDIDSDCAPECGECESCAPDWWSDYYQKSLIGAVAALTKHTNQTHEKLMSLRAKLERGEQ